jgi:transcriptional regulator with XRE-family HTH domain
MLIMPTTKKDPKPAVGLPALLTRCRADKKLRLQDVAKKLGLGVATVSRFERSEGGAARTTQYRVEEFLREHGYLRKRGKAA